MLKAAYEPVPINVFVSMRLRTIRKELKVTQSEPAEGGNVTFQQIQNGKRVTAASLRPYSAA
jgi:hypothetical protein